MLPLTYFLIAWVVFLLIYAVMALLSVVQMLRFGLAGLGTYGSTFLYLLIAGVTILACLLYFSTVDWSSGISLFNGLETSTFLNP